MYAEIDYRLNLGYNRNVLFPLENYWNLSASLQGMSLKMVLIIIRHTFMGRIRARSITRTTQTSRTSTEMVRVRALGFHIGQNLNRVLMVLGLKSPHFWFWPMWKPKTRTFEFGIRGPLFFRYFLLKTAQIPCEKSVLKWLWPKAKHIKTKWPVVNVQSFL